MGIEGSGFGIWGLGFGGSELGVQCLESLFARLDGVCAWNAVEQHLLQASGFRVYCRFRGW